MKWDSVCREKSHLDSMAIVSSLAWGKSFTNGDEIRHFPIRSQPNLPLRSAAIANCWHFTPTQGIDLLSFNLTILEFFVFLWILFRGLVSLLSWCCNNTKYFPQFYFAGGCRRANMNVRDDLGLAWSRDCNRRSAGWRSRARDVVKIVLINSILNIETTHHDHDPVLASCWHQWRQPAFRNTQKEEIQGCLREKDDCSGRLVHIATHLLSTS